MTRTVFYGLVLTLGCFLAVNHIMYFWVGRPADLSLSLFFRMLILAVMDGYVLSWAITNLMTIFKNHNQS